MIWYDRAMKELDEWFKGGPATVERYQEYNKCKNRIYNEYRKTM